MASSAHSTASASLDITSNLEKARLSSNEDDNKSNKVGETDGIELSLEKGNGDDIAGGDDADNNNIGYPSDLKLAAIVIALVLSMFLISLDMTIVATAVPKITDEFKSLLDVAWYGSAFFITIGGFQSAWGKAYKYFPLKVTFMASIAIFEIGSLICGVAPTSEALIIGRAIAGIGAAGVSSGTYTIIAFAAEPKKRPVFTGILGASYGIASVVGPLIGGIFSDYVTWRWCFYINLPIGGVSAGIILLFFKTPPTAKPIKAPLKEKILQMDPLGTLLIMGCVVCLILSMQYGGQTYAWNSGVVIGLLVGFFVILIAFIILEAHLGERAMLVTRIMKRRVIWVTTAFQFCFAGSYYAVLYYLPIYFQSVDNTSPTESGVRNIPLILALTICTILSGGFITKTGIAAPLLVTGATLATIGSGLLYMLDIGTGSGKWIGYQILAGVGWGIGFQVPIIMSQGTSAPEDLAPATAVILFFQTLGGAFFVAIAQCAFVNEMLRILPFSAPDVSPMRVVSVGATEIRANFPQDQVQGIVMAYMSGIKIAFAIATAGVGISVIVCLFAPFKRLGSK